MPASEARRKRGIEINSTSRPFRLLHSLQEVRSHSLDPNVNAFRGRVHGGTNVARRSRKPIAPPARGRVENEIASRSRIHGRRVHTSVWLSRRILNLAGSHNLQARNVCR